jgi:hypothetical protein
LSNISMGSQIYHLSKTCPLLVVSTWPKLVLELTPEAPTSSYVEWLPAEYLMAQRVSRYVWVKDLPSVLTLVLVSKILTSNSAI